MLRSSSISFSSFVVVDVDVDVAAAILASFARRACSRSRRRRRMTTEQMTRTPVLHRKNQKRNMVRAFMLPLLVVVMAVLLMTPGPELEPELAVGTSRSPVVDGIIIVKRWDRKGTICFFSVLLWGNNW